MDRKDKEQIVDTLFNDIDLVVKALQKNASENLKIMVYDLVSSKKVEYGGEDRRQMPSV